MRQLGQLSKAPIEPDEMGRIIQGVIDNVDGVIGGGVPGAGGYDALYVLYISSQVEGQEDIKRQEIEKELLGTKEAGLSVGVLLSSAGDAKSEGNQSGGLRVEKMEAVKGLEECVRSEVQ